MVYDTPRDRISTPSVMVMGPESIRPSILGDNGFIFRMVVTVFASRVDIESGIEKMDPYVGTTGADSVVAAVHAFDWDAQGMACAFTEMREYSVYDIGDTNYIGAEFVFEVWTSD